MTWKSAARVVIPLTVMGYPRWTRGGAALFAKSATAANHAMERAK